MIILCVFRDKISEIYKSSKASICLLIVFIFIFNDELSTFLNGESDYKREQGQAKPSLTIKQIWFKVNIKNDKKIRIYQQ